MTDAVRLTETDFEDLGSGEAIKYLVDNFILIFILINFILIK